MKKGDHVVVRYTGKLTNGIVFDASSMHGNTPFEFDVGAGNHEERHVGPPSAVGRSAASPVQL